MSANQLAKAAGIGQASLSDVLNRKNKPSFDTLERLCAALGVTLAEFFADDVDETPLDLLRLIQSAKRLTPEQREAVTRMIETMKE